MRKIEISTAFKKDYKRTKTHPHHKKHIEESLTVLLNYLVADAVLPETYRDHALIGNWKGYRECHIKPDLLLIYKKEECTLLRLARMGSHAELFA